MRVLVAEDSAACRCLLAGILIKKGYEVLETEDGLATWALLQRADAPKLIILDWMLPGMEGIEICQRLRKIATDEPPYVIILTSRDDKVDLITGLDSGANDYLSKPYHVGELCARLEVGQRMIEIQAQLADKNHQLQEALDQIHTLRGIVPICAGCKKIRDDQGYWEQVETYVAKHSQASFSHGLCPSCAHVYFPDVSGKTETEEK